MITPSFLLCILDGVGIRAERADNAWALANTPILDKLLKSAPNSALATHGEAVGLPQGQMGNSEVGHMNIGAGRVVLQSLQKISKSLENSGLNSSPQWQKTYAKFTNSRAIHIVGMLSNGGVHSHLDHIIKISRELNEIGKPVFVHAILDGRDTPKQTAKNELLEFTNATKGLNNIHIATISGRFYSMDRDNRWERTQTTYNAYVNADGQYEKSWQDAINKAYANGDTDEFIKPTILNLPAGLDPRIQQDDSIFFANFRADRMRQLVKCFINDPKLGFKHGHIHKLKAIATLTEYDKSFSLDVEAMFPPEDIKQTIGEVISDNGIKQLRLAESEKYAHVTYFLNGGREAPFNGEDRIVIPSPKVKTYDLAPEMSLGEVSHEVISAINSKKFGFICLNIANGDQVGHSGDLEASIKAMEHVDLHLGNILNAIKANNGQALIIADHGNLEEMLLENGEPNPSHTTNLVPCIYVGQKDITLNGGKLADVAPTVLYLMGLKIPPEMDGICLAN